MTTRSQCDIECLDILWRPSSASFKTVSTAAGWCWRDHGRFRFRLKYWWNDMVKALASPTRLGKSVSSISLIVEEFANFDEYLVRTSEQRHFADLDGNRGYSVFDEHC